MTYSYEMRSLTMEEIDFVAGGSVKVLGPQPGPKPGLQQGGGSDVTIVQKNIGGAVGIFAVNVQAKISLRTKEQPP